MISEQQLVEWRNKKNRRLDNDTWMSHSQAEIDEILGTLEALWRVARAVEAYRQGARWGPVDAALAALKEEP